MLVGIGSFFLTRDLLSSEDDATAESSPAPESPAGDRKKELDEVLARVAADQAKGRFTGELGDYFFIGTPEIDAVPPELSDLPYELQSCEFVSISAADTPLYVELPPEVNGAMITPTSPPQALKCGGEIVSAEHVGKIEAPNSAGDLSVHKGLLYHPRYVFSYGWSRERYELIEIAGRPAILIAAFGAPEASHVNVIVKPFSNDKPGLVAGVDGDLTREQAITLAEQITASRGGSP
jgi:hypothetical protein